MMVALMFAIVMVFGCSKDGQDGLFSAFTENFNSPKDHVVSGNLLYWNNGDEVVINNGTYSLALDGSHATINASGVTPYGGAYYAAYPAAYASVGTDGKVVFDIPRKETYSVSGGSQVIHSVMAARTTDTELKFSNLCSLLHFRLKASGSGIGAKLCAIEVASDKPLCGGLSAAYSGGSWVVTPQAGVADTVRILTFPTPVELDGTAKDFYLIVAPMSGAAKFRLRYVLENGTDVVVFDKRKSSSVQDLVKGNVYHFEENTYTGTEMTFSSGSLSPVVMSGTLSNPYLVSSETTWDLLMTAAYAGNGSKYIELANDIIVAGNSYTGFAATLDGKGHTVTLSGDAPLFVTISSGTVKNLVLDAEATMSPSTAGSGTRYFGVLAKQATSATIQNCVNKADVEWFLGGSTNSYYGGLLGDGSGCNISGCYNEGQISSDALYIGGVVGHTQSSSTISGCINKGKIIYQTPTSRSAQVYMGGIAGNIAASDNISDCVNLSDIEMPGSTTGNYIYVGGVVGMTKCNISNCGNRGTMKFSSSTTNNKYIGGICGGQTGSTAATMINCYNEGDIVKEGSADRMNVGGLLGRCDKMTIKNSYVYCGLDGNIVAGIVNDGGGLYGEIPVSNCYFYGTISGTTKYGVCGSSGTDSDRFMIDHCYYPSECANMCGSNSHNNGNNSTLTNAFTLTGGAALYSTLIDAIPEGGKSWRNGTTHVVFDE